MGYFTNSLKTTIFLALLTALVLWIGNLLGGTNGLAVAFLFVLIINGLMYWFSAKIVLWMYKAKKLPKDHRAVKLVQEVARKAKLPVMPEVYIVDTPNPNAFATGRSPSHAAVAVTTGILHLLDDEELKAVIAHEISHVKNRDTLITTIAGVLAGVISYVASMARWGAILGGFGGNDNERSGNLISLLVIGILAPLMALIIQLAISRSREYMADESGAKLMHDGKPLARALRKLEAGNKAHPLTAETGNPATSSLFITNPFRGNMLFELFSTHPAMEKRIANLEAMKF